jgi:hypothetical protein
MKEAACQIDAKFGVQGVVHLLQCAESHLAYRK